MAKSTGYHKTSPLVDEPFFKDSGVKKPHRVIKPTIHRLNLEDIEDVESWYPIVEEILILRRIPVWRMNAVKPVEKDVVIKLLDE